MTKEAIVKGLKKVAGADKDKARLFADVIRDIIVEGLVADGVVKIKGLGTFKVVEVKARKSVDVNTGAEIEISAHKKVTFTAESQLANDVNEPLAHLEVMNLGGDAENNKNGLQPEMPVEEKQEEMPATDVADEKKDEAIRKLSEDAEDLKGLLAMINGPLKPAEPEQPIIEPEQSIIEPEQPVVAEQPVTEPEQPIVPVQPVIEPVAEPIQPKVEPEHHYGPTPIDLGPTPGVKKNIFLRIVVIVVAALLIGCGCFWGIKELGKRKTADSSDNSQKKIVKVVKKSEDERLAEIEKIKAEAQKNEKEQIDTGYVYTGIRQPQKEEPIPVDNALAVVRVKEGDRLMTLSKQYYGHRMFWVYIYDANKSQLRNPNELRVGMTLVIPRMDKKLIDVENEESVQAAMKLEAKFMSR